MCKLVSISEPNAGLIIVIFTKCKILSTGNIVHIHTHTHTHIEAPAHTSILTIQNLIYTQNGQQRPEADEDGCME